MDVYKHAAECVNKFLSDAGAPEKTKQRLNESLAIVREACEQHTEEELAFSFNGGKDCLVMLYIVLAVVKKPIRVVYIRTADTFPEVDQFVEDCAEKYQLSMETSTMPMKEAFANYLSIHKEIKAIFVGIRRGDPWSENLKYVQPTDHGWPHFLRIHPVIDWDYDDVWSFLRTLKIPYCSLYDHGYTSLGSTASTIPNPELRRADGTFAPAYELKNPSLERVGRNVAPST